MTDRLRAEVSRQSTTTLLALIDQIEENSDRDQSDAMIYAIACAQVARRLDLNAEKVLSGTLSPGAVLRFVHEMRRAS